MRMRMLLSQLLLMTITMQSNSYRKADGFRFEAEYDVGQFRHLQRRFVFWICFRSGPDVAVDLRTYLSLVTKTVCVAGRHQLTPDDLPVGHLAHILLN